MRFLASTEIWSQSSGSKRNLPIVQPETFNTFRSSPLQGYHLRFFHWRGDIRIAEWKGWLHKTIRHIFRCNSRGVLRALCSRATYIQYCCTVPKRFVIRFSGLNFLDVPKSMTFILESGCFETNRRFSGFKSLKVIREYSTCAQYFMHDNKPQHLKFISWYLLLFSQWRNSFT